MYESECVEERWWASVIKNQAHPLDKYMNNCSLRPDMKTY